MNKKLISKLLAVAVIATGVGFGATVNASAATNDNAVAATELSNTNEASKLYVVGRFTTQNPEVNCWLNYSAKAQGGSGNYYYYFKLMKGEKVINEKRGTDESAGFVPKEAGYYTIIFTAVDKETGKSAIYQDGIMVKDTGKCFTAPSNFRIQYITDNYVRVSWDPSVTKGCKVSRYVIVGLPGHAGSFTTQTYADFELQDEPIDFFVVAEDMDSGMTSDWSQVVTLPAKLK